MPTCTPAIFLLNLPDKYMAVDFGIVGSLSLSDQRYLAENFLAFFNRDYRQVAEMHVESGWVPSSTRIEEFESAIRSVCEPIFEKPLKDISFGQLLLRFSRLRGVLICMFSRNWCYCKKPCSILKVWVGNFILSWIYGKPPRPSLEKWFHERLGPKAKINKIIKQFPEIAEQFPGTANTGI